MLKVSEIGIHIACAERLTVALLFQRASHKGVNLMLIDIE